jgi:hypothetical protein
MPIEKIILEKLYLNEKRSVQEIADDLDYSANKVKYWMTKYNIPTRTHSEATYVKRNPDGDPFLFNPPENREEFELFGMGLGLYWGEGNKANLNSIRLGNTNPLIIVTFMNFLMRFFRVQRDDFKFGLQLFTDINTQEALDFWTKALNIERSQINQPVITKSGSIGTYRKKSQYGVMTVMYHNKKLRDLLISLLPL